MGTVWRALDEAARSRGRDQGAQARRAAGLSPTLPSRGADRAASSITRTWCACSMPARASRDERRVVRDGAAGRARPRRDRRSGRAPRGAGAARHVPAGARRHRAPARARDRASRHQALQHVHGPRARASRAAHQAHRLRDLSQPRRARARPTSRWSATRATWRPSRRCSAVRSTAARICMRSGSRSTRPRPGGTRSRTSSMRRCPCCLQAHRRWRVPPASARLPGGLAPGFARGLDALLARACAIDPQRRYADAEEMSAALDELAPTVASPDAARPGLSHAGACTSAPVGGRTSAFAIAERPGYPWRPAPRGGAVNCPSCEAEARPEDNFCANCGARLQKAQPDDSPCRECGGPVPSGSRFCGICGANESARGGCTDEAAAQDEAAGHRHRRRSAADRAADWAGHRATGRGGHRTEQTDRRAAAGATRPGQADAESREHRQARRTDVHRERRHARRRAAQGTRCRATRGPVAARTTGGLVGSGRRDRGDPVPAAAGLRGRGRRDAVQAPAATSRPPGFSSTSFRSRMRASTTRARPSRRPPPRASPTTVHPALARALVRRRVRPTSRCAPRRSHVHPRARARPRHRSVGACPRLAAHRHRRRRNRRSVAERLRFRRAARRSRPSAAVRRHHLRPAARPPHLRPAARPPHLPHAVRRRLRQPAQPKHRRRVARRNHLRPAARPSHRRAGPRPRTAPVRARHRSRASVPCASWRARPPRRPTRCARRNPASLQVAPPIGRSTIAPSDSAAETLEFDVDAEFDDGGIDPAALSTSGGARVDRPTPGELEEDEEEAGDTVVDSEFDRQDRTVVSPGPPRPPVFDDDEPSVRADAPAAVEAMPQTNEGTVVARRPSAPAPYRGDDAPAVAAPSAVVELVARSGSTAPPRTTVVPTERDRPQPPAPFGGAPPPGSTLVPGTTPTAGGFAAQGDPDEDAATVHLPEDDPDLPPKRERTQVAAIPTAPIPELVQIRRRSPA